MPEMWGNAFPYKLGATFFISFTT